MRYGFCWIKYEGYSCMGEILDYNNDFCVVRVGNTVFADVPLDKVQAPYECKLPWE